MVRLRYLGLFSSLLQKCDLALILLGEKMVTGVVSIMGPSIGYS